MLTLILGALAKDAFAITLSAESTPDWTRLENAFSQHGAGQRFVLGGVAGCKNVPIMDEEFQIQAPSIVEQLEVFLGQCFADVDYLWDSAAIYGGNIGTVEVKLPYLIGADVVPAAINDGFPGFCIRTEFRVLPTDDNEAPHLDPQRGGLSCIFDDTFDFQRLSNLKWANEFQLVNQHIGTLTSTRSGFRLMESGFCLAPLKYQEIDADYRGGRADNARPFLRFLKLAHIVLPLSLLAMIVGLCLATSGDNRTDRVGTVLFLVGLLMVIGAAMTFASFVFGHIALG